MTTTGAAIDRWRSTGIDLVGRIEKFGRSTWNILTLSLTEGAISPKKGVSAYIDKGTVRVVHASRFLWKTKVRGFRNYTFAVGNYPKPDILASTISLAMKELKASKIPITLNIPPDWVIIRTAELPSTVKEHLSDVVGYEIDRLTPFTPETAYYNFNVLDETDGHVHILLLAVKADKVNPYLRALKEQGVTVEKMTAPLSGMAGARPEGTATAVAGEEFSGTAGKAVWESLSNGAGLNILEKGVKKKTRPPMAVSAILAVLLFCTWIPYAIVPLQREEKRLVRIEQQISMRRSEVKESEALRKEVKALSDDVASISAFKRTKPMTLVILKELTAIVPRNTWITRTRITDTTVDVEGYAKSASEILPKLEESKYLRKVEFSSPTVRDTRMDADRFAIKAEIEDFGGSRPGTPDQSAGHEGERPKDGTKK